mgnify:CR=1 FL=1
MRCESDPQEGWELRLEFVPAGLPRRRGRARSPAGAHARAPARRIVVSRRGPSWVYPLLLTSLSLCIVACG